MRIKQFCLQSVFTMLMAASAYAVDFPYSEWNLANYEGAYSTFSEGIVSIANGGSDYWNVQLTRRNIELQSGKTYELKFFLQGVGAQKRTEIRIGRDGFPYDAFAEFGEVSATVNGRIVTKTFTMQSGDVNDARLEFNFGKNVGTLYFSDVSLNCLDCNTYVVENGEESSSTLSNADFDYVVVADEADFRDNSMALGDVFGSKLELGVDTKIYGDVESSKECFLRNRSHVEGKLRYVNSCTKQDGAYTASENKANLQKPVTSLGGIEVGVLPVSVGLDGSITLYPGKFDSFYANARSKVNISAGAYSFSNFFTEPDVKFNFDMTSGPIVISVAGNVRFGDRNHFTITGGNASEITWKVNGESVDLGTDGLYFGRFIAPLASLRMPSRSHLVGSVYAKKFLMEPQSTVSQPPRAEEISHSEEHFGPFFEPGVYRYRSQLPLETSSVEMFVYVKNATFKVNGGNSTIVNLPSTKGTVTVSVAQNKISGFPVEAFTTNYVFDFTKSTNYKVYWNPQTSCKQGCNGATPSTAIGEYAKVLEIAKTTGREINMVGGVWNATANYADGIVPWKVGFELVGYTGDIWDLESEQDLPLVNLGKKAYVEIEGRSPRSMTGLRFANGFNLGDGGAIHSNSQKTNLKTVMISSSNAGGDGGALATTDTLNLEAVHFMANGAAGNGGAVCADGLTNMLNVVYKGNVSLKNGGAVELKGGNTYIGNAIFYNNSAAGNGGAIDNDNASLNLWNATLFANAANGKNGAIAGTAKGTIGNSIFWKNVASGCTGACAGEVVNGYTAMNSSFSQKYAGTNIYVGDPKFADESKPEGDNMFMSYSAGLNLSEKSPLLKGGIDGNMMPRTDIIGSERDVENLPLGVYSFVLTPGEIVYGKLQQDGTVGLVNPAIPIYKSFPDEWFIKYLAKSKHARTIKVKVTKSKYTKVSSVVVTLTLLDKNNNSYGFRGVNVRFYRTGTVEDGKYVFQSMTSTQGKPILFSNNESDAGVYDDAIILCIKDATDKFHYYINK